MNRPLRAFVNVLMLLFVLSVFGCGRGTPSGPPRFDLVKVGMTVQQVEAVLGKPRYANALAGHPDIELRWYQGDGNNTIFVTFKNGIVEQMHDEKPRSRIGI